MKGNQKKGKQRRKTRKKDKKKKKKQKGTEVVMLHPESGESHSFEHVDSYLLADGGDLVESDACVWGLSRFSTYFGLPS